MPNISPYTNDGVISSTSGVSWNFVRQGTSGTADSSGGSGGFAVRSRKVSSGRGTQWVVSRAFFTFNTSGIAVAPASANLNIYGTHGGTADLFVVKSTQASTLANSDFDAITGWDHDADNSSNVTYYSSEVTSWSTSGYNTIALNATALTDMRGLSTFNVCLIEADYDLTNTEPSTGTDVFSGVYFIEWVNSYERPYLDYTPATVAVADNATFFGANF